VNTEQHSPNEAITATSLPSNSLSSPCVACRGIAYINEQELLSQFHDNKNFIGHETGQRISEQLLSLPVYSRLSFLFAFYPVSLISVKKF
jgi:hypothetical protein